jgi:hypothetical protein
MTLEVQVQRVVAVVGEQAKLAVQLAALGHGLADAVVAEPQHRVRDGGDPVYA